MARTTCDVVGTKCRKFNDYVRGELRRKKLKQSDLADYLNCTTSNISHKINGTVEWSFRDVLNTLEFFEAQMEDVF